MYQNFREERMPISYQSSESKSMFTLFSSKIVLNNAV